MASAQLPLEAGERVVFRTGLHPMTFFGALITAAFVALIVTLLIRHNDLPAATDLRIALVGLGVAVLGAVPALLRWRSTAVVVTDRRLLVMGGAGRGLRLSEALGDISVEQSPGVTGRLLDHGTVTIATAESLRSIGHVARAAALVQAVRGEGRRRVRHEAASPGT